MTTAMTMTIPLWSKINGTYIQNKIMYLDTQFFYSDILSFILFVLALQLNEPVFLCVHLRSVCVYAVTWTIILDKSPKYVWPWIFFLGPMIIWESLYSSVF